LEELRLAEDAPSSFDTGKPSVKHLRRMVSEASKPAARGEEASLEKGPPWGEPDENGYFRLKAGETKPKGAGRFFTNDRLIQSHNKRAGNSRIYRGEDKILIHHKMTDTEPKGIEYWEVDEKYLGVAEKYGIKKINWIKPDRGHRSHHKGGFRHGKRSQKKNKRTLKSKLTAKKYSLKIGKKKKGKKGNKSQKRRKSIKIRI